MEEIIRAKNSRGEIVEIPRKQWIFRPSVYGLIRNEGDVLVVRNKPDGKFWLPGGGIELGETREQALRREIDEETGLTDINVGPMIGVLDNFIYREREDQAMHVHLFFYSCETSSIAVKPNDQIIDDEIADTQWIPVQSIQPGMFCDLDKEIISFIKAL